MCKQFFRWNHKPAVFSLFLLITILFWGNVNAYAADYTVTNTNDSGVGSLRWAIEQAGISGNGNITFATALSGQTISLTSDLTGYNEGTGSAIPLGPDSGSFTLTGLTDASGAPAITIDGNGHRGIWASGTGTFSIKDMKFTDFAYSDASGSHDGCGSALVVAKYGTINISNVIFDSNSAGFLSNGGNVTLVADDPYIVNVDRCVFSNNTISAASTDGSALPCIAALNIGTEADITISNSLFYGNSSVSNTPATAYGSAVFFSGGIEIKSYNNTFYGNHIQNNSGASAGAAVVLAGAYGSDVSYQYNNIMISNTANGVTSDILNYNNITTVHSGNNLTSGSPFVNAAEGNFRLAAGASSAINSGDNSHVAGSYDLAGKTRIAGGTVDIGAYEYITVVPTISGAAYNAITGVLDVTAANMTTGDTIAVNKLTLTGEGGNTYTLTTGNVTASSATAFSVMLNAVDKAAVKQILNKNGTSSTGGTTYNLAGAEDWEASVDAALNIADLAGNGITVSNANAAPIITNLNGNSVTYTEDGPAVILDNGNDATVTDDDSPDFSGGNVTVAITVNRSGTEDILEIVNEGTGEGQIGISGSNVTFGGVIIGTFTGGTGTDNLVVSLNANSTPANVLQLIRRLAYRNVNAGNPNPAARTVRVTINDGDGATSSNTLVTVNIAAVNDAPVITITNANADNIYNGTQTINISGTISDADRQSVDVSAAINGKIRNVSIDTSTTNVWTLEWDISGLGIEDGTYTGISFNADDSSGGTVAAAYTGDITVDTIPPDTTLTATPAVQANSTSASFGFSSEAGAAFEVSMDGGAYAAAESPKTYTGMAEGPHTFSVRAVDAAGNVDASPASYTWTIDTTAPTISISAPSAELTSNSDVTYTVTYTGADTITLANANVTLNRTGTANGTVSVAGAGSTRTVSISGITGDGTIGVSIAAGTASDNAGNTAAAAGPSAVFAVDNSTPLLSISAPSAELTSSGDVTYTVTYTGADTITLVNANVTLNRTGTADGTVTVSGAGSTRTVSISGITGDGAIGISIAAGTASDTAGHTAAAAGPSAAFTVDNTAPGGTVEINNGAQYMTDTNVVLDITGNDGTGSGVDQMRFQVNGGVWSPWESFSTTKAGNLPVGYGTVTVSMQLKDNAGKTSGSISDTILYKSSPAASGTTKYGTEDTAMYFTVTDFVYSSSDGSGLIEISIDTLPAVGDLEMNSTSITTSQQISVSDVDNITYVPEEDWNGSTSFTWSGFDGTLWTAPATINLVVAGVNDAPVANNKSISVDVDTPGSGILTATDADGDVLTYSVVSQGAKGELVITDLDAGNFTYTPFTGVTGNDTVTYWVYDQTDYSNIADINISIVPANIADLASISISSGTLSPTFERNVTDYQASVMNSIGFITVTASTYESHSTMRINGVPTNSGVPSNEIALSVGENIITIEVTAQNGMVKNYTINVTRQAAASGDRDSDDGPAAPVVPASPSGPSTGTGVNIEVNGKSETAGTATTGINTKGQTVTTITIDEEKLERRLSQEGSNAVVTISFNTRSDVVLVELNGQMVKNMEIKQAVLEVKTETASYTLPAQQIDIDAISEQIGTKVDLRDIKVKIEIAKPSEEMVRVVENSAKAGEFTIVAPPVEFNITCIYKDRIVQVGSFNSYVERIIAIPEGVDPNKITTGIVVDPDGTVRHVPTRIVVIDGRYYARINSLTNSFYSVIWHPMKFMDMERHWAGEAVNDMGSRMVISGVDGSLFEPDRYITRAEFAAVMVRALGLKPGTGSKVFKDVKADNWYGDYIKTAYEYKLINGYNEAEFGPEDAITREQAMTVLGRAMKITGLRVEIDAEDTKKLLEAFKDGNSSSAYAKAGIAACVKAGVVSGRENGKLAPRNSITRAEVAVMARRLLQKSNLI